MSFEQQEVLDLSALRDAILSLHTYDHEKARQVYQETLIFIIENIRALGTTLHEVTVYPACHKRMLGRSLDKTEKGQPSPGYARSSLIGKRSQVRWGINQYLKCLGTCLVPGES